MSYIVALTVLIGAATLPPEGYTKIDVDLNAGAGGEYLYFAYKTSSYMVQALTDIDIEFGNTPAEVYNPPEYKRIDVDLNKESGGKYIYAHYTRNKIHGDAITELRVIRGSNASIECDPNFVKIPTNLNEGVANSPYLYLCYAR